MNNHSSNFFKTLLLPCLTFSIAAGIFSALLITLFKLAAEEVIFLSNYIYATVRANPIWLTALLAGAALLGLLESFLLTFLKSCRGGGIPTTIAAIRGITDIKWLSGTFALPFTALITFFCGIPLGTEGPCVQMGAAIGDGVVYLLGGKKNIGWHRYIMTGGASAGFSLATGAPITAIIFSMEELHQRFSPLLFSVASISVISAQVTARLLAYFNIGSLSLFHLGEVAYMPSKLLFIPLIIGLVCGGGAVFLTHLYHTIDKLVRIKLEKLSVKIKFPIIFVCVALVGFFLSEILGSGHSLIDHLFETRSLWYVLIIVFLVRAIFMLSANTAGVTGGLFLPTLSYGAIIGALAANVFIDLGIIGAEHYLFLVILGTVAFLGASSHIPLTACAFAIEVLCGINNILAVIIAVTAAFIVVELSKLNDFSETVIEAKEHAIHKNKTSHVIEVPLTVYEGSFVIGKELNDILWPASCVVLSFERGPNHANDRKIAKGDVLTVYYKTYDPIATAEEFEVLVGDQAEEIDKIMRPI